MNGSASCSVNNNPLVKFNKFEQQQNGNLGQRVGSSSSLQFNNNIGTTEQFRSNHNAISENNKHQMNHFIHGNTNMSDINNVMTSPTSSVSLQLGMNKMSMPKMSKSSWSSNQIPTLNTMKEGQMMSKMSSSTSLQGMTMNSTEWSKEFQLRNNSNSNLSMNSSMYHQQQQRQSSMSPSYYQPMQYYPNNNSNLGMFSNNSLSNTDLMRSMNINKQNKSDTTNWDQQFNDLEKEVSEVLHINETNDATENNLNKIVDDDNNIKEEIEIDEDLNRQHETDNEGEIIIDNDYQAEFQEVWDSIHHDADDIMPNNYLHGQRFFNTRTELGNIKYDFENTKNEYLKNPNAYEIGCILMENGAKLSEAAMAFEAAVQQRTKHVDAWLKLGLVQIQNEKEINGISALENCLKLDPNNLEAMKNLAISYINEGYDSSSFTILNKWIETKYPQIDTSLPEINNLSENELEDPLNLNEKITKRFLKLANQLPMVDPDVQLCLGLLFYANDDFVKTIDCFKAALNVNPNDELMWNRLGAALANSNRSEESIKAYHRALQLKPSFVRARYNLAVSSMNIGCYKEAVEQLLTSLSMHEVEGLKQKENDLHSFDNYNNDNILETLKRAFIAMNRNDLLQKIMPGMDLQQFRNEFNF